MKFLNIAPIGQCLTLSLLLSVSHACAETSNVHVSTIKNSKSYEQLANKICEIILQHSLTKDIDAAGSNVHVAQENQHGFSELKKKLQEFIVHGKPIVFTLISFPFKSGNTEKNVLGPLPDLAERIALEKMQKFMAEISHIYAPDAKLMIYTNELAFFDLLGVSFESVAQYEKTLKQLVKDLPNLSIVTLQDLYPDLSAAQIQKKINEVDTPLNKLSPVEEEVLSKRLLTELHYPQGKAILAKTSLTSLAEAMNGRSKKLGQIYKNTFPKSILLSTHYQEDVRKKVGVALSPSNLTPWHGVAVLKKDGSFSIVRKTDLSKDLKPSSKIVNGILCHYYTN